MRLPDTRMAHDVFISYSVSDKPVADAVCAHLERAGIRCWIAPRDLLPGQEYGADLVAAIGTSRIVALVLSTNSATSPQVLREIERAVHLGVAILPLRIDEVEPSGSMEYFISTTHWLDAMTPPLEQHLARMVAAAEVLLQKAPSAGRTRPTRDRVRVPEAIPTLAFENDPRASVGARYDEAVALGAQAADHARQGRAKEAMAAWESAVALCRDAKGPAGEQPVRGSEKAAAQPVEATGPPDLLFVALRLELCKQAAHAAREEADRLKADNKIDQAMEILEDALRIFGDDLRTIRDGTIVETLCACLWDRGGAELKAEHYTNARRDFARTLELKPDNDRARRGLATAYNNEGVDTSDPDEAMRLLRKALELQPDGVNVRRNLAGALRTKAVKTWNALSAQDVRSHIDEIITWLEEAVKLAATNMKEEAVPVLVMMAQTSPDTVNKWVGVQGDALLIQILKDLTEMYKGRKKIR